MSKQTVSQTCIFTCFPCICKNLIPNSTPIVGSERSRNCLSVN